MTLLTCKPYAFLLALAFAAAAAANEPPQAAVPPGYSTTVTGSAHDFDYFMGSGWQTTQHRLKATGVGSKEWNTFPATLCATPYLGGMATVDELYMPSKGTAGLTLRTFNPAKRQWSIYWINSRDGVLEMPPMLGGFNGKQGEFYNEDHDAQGRPVKVRFIWTLRDHDHARWEQAFSYDNRTWETNWTADFLRGDRAKLCEDGRPRR
jgi:hypothetical protein